MSPCCIRCIVSSYDIDIDLSSLYSVFRSLSSFICLRFNLNLISVNYIDHIFFFKNKKIASIVFFDSNIYI